jgi:hypothetical protein
MRPEIKTLTNLLPVFTLVPLHSSPQDLILVQSIPPTYEASHSMNQPITTTTKTNGSIVRDKIDTLILWVLIPFHMGL